MRDGLILTGLALVALAIAGCEPADLLPKTDWRYEAYGHACSLIAFALQEKDDQPAPEPDDKLGKCTNCDGKGKVGDGTVFVKCIVCNGDGKIDPDDIQRMAAQLQPKAAAEPPKPVPPPLEPAKKPAVIPLVPQGDIDSIFEDPQAAAEPEDPELPTLAEIQAVQEEAAATREALQRENPALQKGSHRKRRMCDENDCQQCWEFVRGPHYPDVYYNQCPRLAEMLADY
jgi:hypothetical protein